MPGRLDRIKDEANYPDILDAVLFIARMYALHDDESMTGRLCKAVRTSVRQPLLAHTSVQIKIYTMVLAFWGGKEAIKRAKHPSGGVL
jgi:hypothetical protein